MKKSMEIPDELIDRMLSFFKKHKTRRVHVEDGPEEGKFHIYIDGKPLHVSYDNIIEVFVDACVLHAAIGFANA